MKTKETKDLDLASYVAIICKEVPNVVKDHVDGQAIFEFSDTKEVQSAMVEYATGKALVEARPLLGMRKKLYYAVRGIGK